MVRYIVTGAAGHLGSTVIRQLLEEGQLVRDLILPSEESSLPGAEYVRGDVLKPENLGPLFHRDSNERLVVIHIRSGGTRLPHRSTPFWRAMISPGS